MFCRATRDSQHHRQHRGSGETADEGSDDTGHTRDDQASDHYSFFSYDASESRNNQRTNEETQLCRCGDKTQLPKRRTGVLEVEREHEGKEADHAADETHCR